MAINQGVIFTIGTLVFIAVFTAALGPAYARFERLGEDRPTGTDLDGGHR
jgi:hypothetical protein